MTISELLAALAAKLSAMGVAAKTALALGLATATAVTTGAAGVLPGPAQHAVASVVNAVSPVQIPDVGGSGDKPSTTDAVTNPPGGVTSADQPAVGGTLSTGDEPTGGDDQGQPADTHGACVSAVAKSAPTGAGGVHGKAVSEAAKSCPKSTSEGSSGTTTTSSSVVPGGGSDDSTATPGAVSDDGQGRGKGQNSNAGGGSRGRGH